MSVGTAFFNIANGALRNHGEDADVDATKDCPRCLMDHKTSKASSRAVSKRSSREHASQPVQVQHSRRKQRSSEESSESLFECIHSVVRVPSSVSGYEHLLPTFPVTHWKALTSLKYEEKGLLGHPKYKFLFATREASSYDYTPKIGSLIEGVRLTQLRGDAQKNDLARLVATKGVVFFRNQDDFDIAAQRNLAGYFGTLHTHMAAPVPARHGLDNVVVLYTSATDAQRGADFSPSSTWQSDVSYEAQPPSYTFFKLLTGPPLGGDTIWASQYAAYDLLPRPWQKYLEGLTALHSADQETAEHVAAGHKVRRSPVTTEHPLVRVNPVTNWKSLFFNPRFVTKVVGVPALESDRIIRYLTDLIAMTEGTHCRYVWGKNDVAIWDSRCTTHRETFGFGAYVRHGVQVSVIAGQPTYDPRGTSQAAGVA